MNAEQKKILTDMQDGTAPQINTVSAANAKALVEGGYVRAARVTPAPKDGVAVNLTARGRGFGRKPAASAEYTPAPVPSGAAETGGKAAG